MSADAVADARPRSFQGARTRARARALKTAPLKQGPAQTPPPLRLTRPRRRPRHPPASGAPPPLPPARCLSRTSSLRRRRSPGASRPRPCPRAPRPHRRLIHRRSLNSWAWGSGGRCAAPRWARRAGTRRTPSSCCCPVRVAQSETAPRTCTHTRTRARTHATPPRMSQRRPLANQGRGWPRLRLR